MSGKMKRYFSFVIAAFLCVVVATGCVSAKSAKTDVTTETAAEDIANETAGDTDALEVAEDEDVAEEPALAFTKTTPFLPPTTRLVFTVYR